jgi:hypothetical protein
MDSSNEVEPHGVDESTTDGWGLAVRDDATGRAICTQARELDLAAFALERAGAEWAEFRAHYARCADCSGEVARFAQLAATLEREAAPPSGHPGERELLGFAGSRGSLRDAARERIALHLAGCAACRSEAGVLQRFDLGALAEAPTGASISERAQMALAWLSSSLRLPWPAPAWALGAAALAIFAVVVWSWREPGASPLEPSQAPLAAVTSTPPAPDTTAAETPLVAPDRAPVAETPPHEIALAPSAPPSPAEPQVPPQETASAIAAVEGAPSAPEPAREEAQPAQRIASLVPVEPPHYTPGALAAGPFVRIAGAGRGAGDDAPSPVALAPAQLGLTSRPSPTLYWFLPAPTSLPIAVTIVSEAETAPLLELTLPGPHATGVHGISLAERGVQLPPGVDHRWFVALVRDPERRSRDLVSSAAIRYAPPDAELAARLADARERLAHAYAEAGLWYDAYDQLSRWLEVEPDAAILHAHRAALLEQVGLTAAAASELSAAPASAPAP